MNKPVADNFITRNQQTMLRVYSDKKDTKSLLAAFFLDRMQRNLPTKSRIIKIMSTDNKSQVSFDLLKTHLISLGMIEFEAPIFAPAHSISEDEKNLYFVKTDLNTGDFTIFLQLSRLHTEIDDAISLEINVIGDDTVPELANWITENIQNVKFCTVTTVLSIDERDACLGNCRDDFLGLDDEGKAEDIFYPSIEVPLQEYFKQFMEAKENILIIYGPPGTGKSTLIRSLLMSVAKEAWLAYDEKVISNSILYNEYLDSDATVLVCEDIDSFLGKRKDGNKLMSSLLNGADGIVKRKNKKIVLSTNLESTTGIDSALMRKGRCFDILKIDELTVEQAKAVIAFLNLPEREFKEGKKVPLAEVLCSVPPSTVSKERKGDVRIGY